MPSLTFLGTGSMLPTKKRNGSSVLLTYFGENILFDCAEGTQRQMRTLDISPTKVTKVLISHWHSDHVLGLIGLLMTLGAHQYMDTLEIYGPKGTRKFFKNIYSSFQDKPTINIDVREVSSKLIHKNKKFSLYCSPLKHSCPCLGYSFVEHDKRKINLRYLKRFNLKEHPILKDLQEGKSIKWKGRKIDVNKATTLVKGKKFTYITDTKYTESAVNLAKNSDILVCESTYTEALKDKAKEYKHMTASEAALIAKKSKSKKLYLTHFSQRYKDDGQQLKEARKIFRNSFLAEDFLALDF